MSCLKVEANKRKRGKIVKKLTGGGTGTLPPLKRKKTGGINLETATTKMT